MRIEWFSWQSSNISTEYGFKTYPIIRSRIFNSLNKLEVRENNGRLFDVFYRNKSFLNLTENQASEICETILEFENCNKKVIL